MSVAQEEVDIVQPGSALELFLTFAGLSLQSFGGAIALIEHTVVRRKRWLGAKEFLGVFAISQVLPGPTGISFCVLLGDRFFGWRGALAATAGFLLVPAVTVLSIASVFFHYQQLPPVQGALHGMGAASVGLVMATAMRMARSLRGERVAMAVTALTFGAVALLRVPIGLVMLTLGVASVVLAWRREGRGDR